MISFGRIAVQAALALSCCGHLVAQGAGASDPTSQFVQTQRNTSNYRAKIQAAVVSYEKGLDAHCKNVSVDFDSGGVAVAGSWRETVPGTACGEERKFNVRVDATLGGLQFTGTVPGEAAGDPDLQNDTLKNIESTFDTRGISTKKGCHLEVIDTHLVGPEPMLQENGGLSPWKETWDVRSCGTVYSVPIAYASDGSGTFIKISSSDIKAE
jgi:hypothetical protein